MKTSHSLLVLPLVFCSLLFAESPPVIPPPPPPAEVVKEDFQKRDVGALPDELMVIEGAFEIIAEGDNKLLQLGVEPMTEGGVLLGKSMKKGGTVKAKIKASSKRRSFPRVAVGMGGTSGYRFKIVPAEKIVEFVKEDARLAKADFAWKTDVWYWIELSVLPATEAGKWNIEGRAWEDGQERPATATLTHAVTDAPTSGKASIWGAPFSEKPIQFDDIEITPAP